MKIANHEIPVTLIGAWVLCLAAVIAVHFGLVAPQGRAVAASQAEAQAAAERFTLLKNAGSEKEQARLATRRQDMEHRFTEYVFTAEQLNQLDFDLRALSEKHNLTDFSARHVHTTTKIGATDLKRIAQREMVLSFNSTFPDFLRFINDMERHYPVLIVDTFTPSVSADKKGLLSCTMECSLLYETTSN